MTSNYRYLKRKFLNVLSFNYRGALAWNQLSNQIRDIKDLASFKSAISILHFTLLGQIFTRLVSYYYRVAIWLSSRKMNFNFNPIY